MNELDERPVTRQARIGMLLLRLVTRARMEELPGLVGRLVEAVELARLRLRSQGSLGFLEERPEPERLLTPEQAAAVLGDVGARWILRHTKGLYFRRNLSSRTIRFEESGLRRWAGRRTVQREELRKMAEMIKGGKA